MVMVGTCSMAGTAYCVLHVPIVKPKLAGPEDTWLLRRTQ
jgi:hypothetical protein